MVLDARHLELFLNDRFVNGSWEYELVASHDIKRHVNNAFGGILDSNTLRVHTQLFKRYTMERPRFSDHLEAIKFICKDFWSLLFKKQIDNLKTNHRGTFVLQDDKFAWLSRMSGEPSTKTRGSAPEAGNKAAETTGMHLYFPCGIIRGALYSVLLSFIFVE
ncbi:putative transport protein particle (TRAPP) component [Helianthus annuus]|nr:putative transport protein particle (TRAPP) component [Helianthus annuus]